MNPDIILFESLLVLALVWLAWTFWLWESKERKNATALSDTAPIVPVLPLFTMTADMVVEFQGRKYRVEFVVVDVQMVEGE